MCTSSGKARQGRGGKWGKVRWWGRRLSGKGMSVGLQRKKWGVGRTGKAGPQHGTACPCTGYESSRKWLAGLRKGQGLSGEGKWR